MTLLRTALRALLPVMLFIAAIYGAVRHQPLEGTNADVEAPTTSP